MRNRSGGTITLLLSVGNVTCGLPCTALPLKTPRRPSIPGHAGALAKLPAGPAKPRPRSPIGGMSRTSEPGPAPVPPPRCGPSLRPGPAALVVQRRRPSSAAASGLAAAGPHADMELEVPDEAESAEAGAVPAEAAWSSDSGATSGNGAAGGAPLGANGPARRPPRRGAVGPPGRGGARGPAAGAPEHSTRGRARGAPGRPTPGPGDAPRGPRGCSAPPALGSLEGQPVWGREWVRGPVWGLWVEGAPFGVMRGRGVLAPAGTGSGKRVGELPPAEGAEGSASPLLWARGCSGCAGCWGTPMLVGALPPRCFRARGDIAPDATPRPGATSLGCPSCDCHLLGLPPQAVTLWPWGWRWTFALGQPPGPVIPPSGSLQTWVPAMAVPSLPGLSLLPCETGALGGLCFEVQSVSGQVQ